MARSPRPSDLAKAAAALQRLLKAVETGELGTSNPNEVALIRRLEGVLAGWRLAVGEPPDPNDHVG